MDVSQWYAIALGGVVGLSIIAPLLLTIFKETGTYILTIFKKTGTCILTIFKKTGTYIKFHFLKHVYYPQVYKYLRGSEETTRFDLGLICVFLAGIVICTTFQVKDVSALRKRSGLMSIINLMPLSLGSRMNLVASYCGISLGTYGRAHRWLGRVAIAEGLIHTAAAVSLQKPILHNLPDIGGLTAAIILVIVLLSSLASMRRRFYEIFSTLHLILTPMLIAATYLHIRSKKLLEPPAVYILAAVSIQIFMRMLRLGNVLYHNTKYKKPLSRASVRTITFKRTSGAYTPVSDAVHVHVRLARPWQHRPGQYAYLTIPSVNFGQSHPFYISWCYRDRDNYYIVFIIQKRKGFSKKLLSHANNDLSQGFKMMALVEGPYGKELILDSYETVLLFATDIGIAGQLPYVAQLLERYRDYGARTRRVSLFWELESELHTAWVADMMKELLSKDTDRILNIQLFVVGRFLSTNTRQGDNSQLGERINITYQVMAAERLIKSEIEGRKGRTVVSLCTNDETGEKIRGIVLRMFNNDIHLEEIGFRPVKTRKTVGLEMEMSNVRVGPV